MKQINLFLVSIAFCFFASCTEKSESPTIVKLSTDLAPGPSEKGAIPDEHRINLMMLTPNKYEFQQVHEMYKEDIENVKGMDYTSNLKNSGFLLAMQTGLLKKGTNEQKKFYLDEQMGIDVNLINFKNFYLLLSDCKDFLGEKKANDYAIAFYTKNAQKIEKFLIDDIQKRKLLSKLAKAKTLYSDYQ